MTRYKLPDELGGGELEAWAVTSEHALFSVGNGEVSIGLDLLVEVAQPTPGEPGALAVVIDCDGRAWQRTGGYRGSWECTHDDAGTDWEGLNREYGPVRRLVPESSDRAQPSTVDLPWTYTDPDGDELTVRVYTYQGRKVAVVEQSVAEGCSPVVHLDTHEARMGAVAAILAADREIGGAE